MEKIIYSNKENLEKILENIKKDWLENLHILADFDKTLTKHFVNWKKRHSLIHSLEEKGYLWENFSKKYKQYFEQYYKFEIDSKLSKNEKSIKMNEWWRKVNDLLIENNLNINNIKEIINDDLIHFRDWVKDFLKDLDNKKVPLIFISANWLWSDAIEIYLEKNNTNYENIQIISNKFVWDKAWKMISYEEPVIHVFNKDETVLKEFPEIYKKIENKKNVILLWDSLWDPHMIDGFDYKNLIKIWFLNDKEEELLESYKQKYDIVITWDWDFEIVNNILEQIN